MRPSQAKVVVFDIDGVLINSASSILAQAAYWLKQIRGRDMTADDLQRAQHVFGATGDPHVALRKILECDDSEWRKNKDYFFQIHNEGFQRFKGTMTPYQGAVQLVRDLRTIKKVAAFTTRERSFFTAVTCPDLVPPSLPDKPDGLFHITITADDVTQVKPHPEGLYTIAKKLHVQLHEMVLIGDSPTDIIAGNQAGTQTIAITHANSFADISLLTHETPGYFARSIDDLRKLLMREA